MTVLAMILEIHQRNFGESALVRDEFATLLEDYDLLGDAPAWFSHMLMAILHAKPQNELFQQVGSNIASVLDKLQNSFGWDIQDYGEGIEIELKNPNISVFISREAAWPDGRGCCSYAVNYSKPN